MTIKILFFYNDYGIEMFTNESHVFSSLINRYNQKVFFKGKNCVFNFMFTENGFYWSACYSIFKGTNFFIYWWQNMTIPCWKMVLVDAFIIWYSLNEFINTSLYFFTSFLKINLFCSSIIWAFGYELSKPLISSNTGVPCYNLTVKIICKELSYLSQQHLDELWSLRNSSVFKWSANYL